MHQSRDYVREEERHAPCKSAAASIAAETMRRKTSGFPRTGDCLIDSTLSRRSPTIRAVDQLAYRQREETARRTKMRCGGDILSRNRQAQPHREAIQTVIRVPRHSSRKRTVLVATDERVELVQSVENIVARDCLSPDHESRDSGVERRGGEDDVR